MSDTTLFGLGLDTFTGTVWSGEAPSHAVWDGRLQVFSFAPTSGAQQADADGVETVAQALRTTLALPPKARQPLGKGHVARPCMRLACPQCREEQLSVPVEVSLNANGVFEAWFGKGDCHCPCGYVGTKAKIKQLGMYDYTDLVQTRPDAGAYVLEQIAERNT
jgi:hypothetical protein